MAAILEVITNPFGYTAVGCLILALTGLGMVIRETIRERGSRRWPAGLLAAALAYTAVNVGVFVTTISADAFAIFAPVYAASVGLFAPVLMIIALLVARRRYRPGDRLGTLGCALWIGCTAFGHLWVIAVASAGV